MLIDFYGVRGIRLTYKYINYRFGGQKAICVRMGQKGPQVKGLPEQ